MTDSGIISFIKNKLECGTPPEEIERMLLYAGFKKPAVEGAFKEMKVHHRDVHQDMAALNDFLPVLRDKKEAMREQRILRRKETLLQTQKGLFRGRLRRRDFTLGFLFFFGVGYIALAFGALFVANVYPMFWNTILDTIQHDPLGLLVMTIPVILAPITVMMLSLITRRLHNIGLPGGLSLLYLVMFVPVQGFVDSYQIWILQGALVILFVVLLTKKGSVDPNRHGPLPETKGSFFRRIFNI